LHCATLAKEHGGTLSLVDDLSLIDDLAAPTTGSNEGLLAGGACFELVWRTAEAPSQVVPSRLPTVRPPPSLEPMSSVSPATESLGRDEASDDRISVPPTVPSLSVPPEPPSVRVSFAGKRLLLLEDDDAVLDMVRFGLTARGADVQVATSASRLADLLAGDANYDAALLDLSPLGAGAGQVLRQLAGMAVPVILISGSVAPEILDAEGPEPSADAPFASWVHKPFALNELYDALVSLDV
jgi:CheY-like chemotaxis protein